VADRRLTAHFTIGEFACKDGTPVPPNTVPQLHELCARFLEPLRERYGPVTVISGYRTPGWNRAVGGAPASYHVYTSRRQGVAADVRCARGAPMLWHELLAELEPGGLGSYSDHVHVDSRSHRARW
jgi:uncharacterized protein YcbK (DUF882 family)